MNRYIFFVLLLVLISGMVQAQPELKFVRYTTREGLVNNDVLTIYQDHLGFMWFGTKGGFSRFDGVEFKNYQYNEIDSRQTGNGWVNNIVEDDKNNLWFAMTGGALIRYNYETEQFININDSIKKQLNAENNVSDYWNLFCDSEGLIWLSHGISYYNPKNNKVKTFFNNVEANAFFEDKTENIWIATYKTGIYVYNKGTDSFISYKHDPDNSQSISSNNCQSIFKDSEGQIWIGTREGLNRKTSSSLQDYSFERYKHEPQNNFTLSDNFIYDINEDSDGNLLIATVNGLCLMDKKTKEIYRYYNSDTNDESINSNLVRVIYRDKQNNIWVGTSNGVGKLQIKNFKSFSYSSSKNSISHNKVEYICEAPGSKVWIATPKGIDVFNKQTNQFNFLDDITQNKNGLYGSPIFLYPEKNNGMWIATWGGGISYFNYDKNRVTDRLIMYNNTLVEDVFSICTDKDDDLWIGTVRFGLYLFEKKTGKYRSFSLNYKNENTINSNAISMVMEDSDDNIWIGSYNGLDLLTDKQKGYFKHYLPGVQINHIIETSDKSLWIGTTTGLIQYDKASEKFQFFNGDNGISENIFGIVEDQFHNLWISAEKSFIRFTPPKGSDSIPEMIIYRTEEGISVGGFNQRSCAKLSNGTIMFGGTKGFCEFYPANVKNDTVSPHVIFTNLKVHNKTVNVGESINDQVVLEKSITKTKNITLNHKNNAITIEFAGLHYNLSQYIQYAYKMEGYDLSASEWHYVNATNRRADYMNLPHGNYTFKVKAANSHGVWNNIPAKLNITILPPWWKTKWFTVVWILAVIILILLLIRLRTLNLQRQKKKLKMLVEQQMLELKEMNTVLQERKEELELQAKKVSDINLELLKTNTNLELKTVEVKNMAKRLHEADQLKLRFFSNVSHEFRTPLSLIIGPLEKCLNMEKPVDWDNIKSSYLQLMHRNSKRLLRLINQVLDFRKIDQDEKKLNISNNNIIEFTQEVVEVFSSYAKSKNINLRYTIEDLGFKKDNQLIINSGELIDLSDQQSIINNQQFLFYNNFWFDPDIMEKILFNLVSNAIKYTPEEGEVSVQLTVNSKQSLNNEELIINNEKLENENTKNDQFFILHYSPLAHENAALSSSFLIIKVSDTGIGIKKENLEKIFERFYREETKYNTTEGTGIGLAYTKELIELHKGLISAASEKGKGTVFTLQFPLGKEAFKNEIVDKEKMLPVNPEYIRSMIDNTREINDEHVKEQPENKPSILIVEDNTDLRKFIKSELLSQFNVYEATNGKEGLELAIDVAPELIISDIMMPVMDGIEFCKRIKSSEDTSHIPVILLTAKGSDEDQVKGLQTGANDYIPKPFNIDVLRIKINNLFLLRKQMQEKFSKSINVTPSEITFSLLDQQFIQKAIEVVNENIHDFEFDNDTFVSHMNLSRAQVYKKIKNITGQSVSEFIRSIRLKAATQLFLEGNFNITEVSYNVGFKYPTDFAKYFGKMFGMSPRQFIKNQN